MLDKDKKYFFTVKIRKMVFGLNEAKCGFN